VQILATTLHPSPDPSQSYYSLSLLSVSASSGELVLPPSAIQTSKLASPRDLVLFSSKLAWLNHDGTVSSVALASSASSPRVRTLGHKGPFQRIVDVGLDGNGTFVAVTPAGSSQIYRFKESPAGEIERIWDFADSTPDAVYSGSVDKEGGVHISRIYFSSVISVRRRRLFTPPALGELCFLTLVSGSSRASRHIRPGNPNGPALASCQVLSSSPLRYCTANSFV
jgi:hypothetical protein